MSMAKNKSKLRAAILADIRANFENWPQYLHEFEDVLSVDEIRSVATEMFSALEVGIKHAVA